MGRSSLVQGNVDKAFKLIGDLASDVTLTHTGNQGFDFSANAVKLPTTNSKVIKGLFIEKKRTRSDTEINSSISTSFMFKAKDLDDPTLYDTITMSTGAVWKMIPPYLNDGFLITVNVAKEG